MLRQILTEPKNSLIWQYKQLLKMDNVELDFREDTLNAIATEAINMVAEREAYEVSWKSGCEISCMKAQMKQLTTHK